MPAGDEDEGDLPESPRSLRRVRKTLELKQMESAKLVAGDTVQNDSERALSNKDETTSPSGTPSEVAGAAAPGDGGGTSCAEEAGSGGAEVGTAGGGGPGEASAGTGKATPEPAQDSGDMVPLPQTEPETEPKKDAEGELVDADKAQAEEEDEEEHRLADGKLILPTFHRTDMVFSEVTTTSVHVAWPCPEDSKHPIYGYRVSSAEIRTQQGGSGTKHTAFEVAYANTDTDRASVTVVSLRPGTRYRFHVAPLSAESMIVPELSAVSGSVETLQARYETAWYFEGVNEDRKWVAYEGSGPASVEGKTKAAMDEIMVDMDAARCFTGIKSLRVHIPYGHRGGCYVDTDVNEGWLYVCKVHVLHDEPPPEDQTRLVLWDKVGRVEMSAPARGPQGEWEELECRVVPEMSDKLRVAVHTGPEYWGNLWVDCVELFHGGPTDLELASEELTGLLQRPRDPPEEVELRILSAEGLRAADTLGTSDPYVKVMVRGEEVHKTNVIPMCLTPAWDEVVRVRGPWGGDDPPGGLRLEVWDYDAQGSGDLLGKLHLSPDNVAGAPPCCLDRPLMERRRPVEGEGTGEEKDGGAGSVEDGLVLGKGSICMSIQSNWPADPSSELGSKVKTFQDTTAPMRRRVVAAEALSSAAMEQPRDALAEVKRKSALVAARAPAAALLALDSGAPSLARPAADVLRGLCTFGRATRDSKMAFTLQRELQRHVIGLCPGAVVVRRLRSLGGGGGGGSSGGGAGDNKGKPAGGLLDSNELMALLLALYRGQQPLLHRDAAAVDGLFYALVRHVELGPVQALLKEISGGRREYPPELVSHFRRYRLKIPPTPGLWRADLLRKLGEEELDPDADEEAAKDEATFDKSRGPSLPERLASYGKYLALAAPAAAMVAIAASLLAGGASCDRPVATALLLDGLLLGPGALATGVFVHHARNLSKEATHAFFPLLCMGLAVHLGLFALLLVSLAGTGPGGGGGCDTGVYAWGVFFAAMLSIAKAALPALVCRKAWRKIVQPKPQVAAADTDDQGGSKAGPGPEPRALGVASPAGATGRSPPQAPPGRGGGGGGGGATGTVRSGPGTTRSGPGSTRAGPGPGSARVPPV